MLNNIRCQTSDLTNTIYIGRVNKKEDNWLEKEDRTDEVLEAVRNHLYQNLKDGETKTCYSWKRKDGKIVKLMLEVCDEEAD